MNDNIKHQIPIEKLAPAGMHGELLVVDIFQGDSRSDDERLSDREIRQFSVTAKISKTTESSTEIKASIEPGEGDSFLLAPDNIDLIKVQSSQGTFTLHKNQRGELAQIIFACEAESPLHAKEKFGDVVVTYLDYLSFISNTPLHVPLVQIIDHKNQVLCINYISPHPISLINPHFANVPQDLRPVFSLYREAKNSSSNFYKLLCYYKILEGVLGPIRTKLFKKIRKVYQQVNRIPEIFPGHPDLDQKLEFLTGKPIKEVSDKYLYKEFRNTVAHFVTDIKEPLNVSSYDANSKFSNIVLVAEICSRIVIENHISYLKQLDSI